MAAGVAVTLAASLAGYAAYGAVTSGTTARPASAAHLATGAQGVAGQGTTPGSLAAAAAAQQIPPASTVTLITGERVRLQAAPGGGQTMTPDRAAGTGVAAGTGDFTQFSWDGDQYLVPDEAVPYLGTVLDPRLFDVSYLARAKLDDAHSKTLPVSVAYTGTAPPALPAVHVTSASADEATAATAAVAKAKAPRLGRLLASRWRSGKKTRLASPSGLLPGIARISLRRPADAPALPALPLFQAAGQGAPRDPGSRRYR
jgi:hypothetical protein